MLTKPYLYYHALGSWHTGGRSALEEYKERRIGEAVFIDIDELSDQNNELPHMLPSANQFSHHVGKVCYAGCGWPWFSSKLGQTDKHKS